MSPVTYRTGKMGKKSARWWRHGKHAKLDPRLIANDRRPRPAEWFPTIQDALAAMRKRRGKVGP